MVTVPAGAEMDAVLVHEFGGPEVLRPGRLPVPRPGPDQVLVAVEAVGVGFAQTQMRAGRVKLYTTGLDAGERKLTGVDSIASVETALADAMARAADGSLAVIPEGPYVVPVVA